MMETHEDKAKLEVAETCIEKDHEQVIEANPYATVATTKILSLDDDERLFHSQMWVGGKALHFIVEIVEAKRT